MCDEKYFNFLPFVVNKNVADGERFLSNFER